MKLVNGLLPGFFLLSEQAAKMSRQREDGKAYSNLQYWQPLTDKIFLSGTKGCFFFVVKDNYCLIINIRMSLAHKLFPSNETNIRKDRVRSGSIRKGLVSKI